MTWYRYTRCIDFPRKILPILARAIEKDEIVWINKEMVGFNIRGDFKWLDCEWHIYENNNTVEYIKLVQGALDSEDLTAAVLRG